MTELKLAGRPADLFDLGNTLLERGQAGAAIDAFKRSLALAPNHAASLYNLGNALLQAGSPVEAVEAFVQCLRVNPAFGAAYVNLATALGRIGLLEQARTMAELGIHYLPDLPEAKVCLANVLHDCAEYQAASELYAWALDREPDDARTLTGLGNTLHAMGRLAEALVVHDRAVAVAPGDADCHFNRATTRLAAGDFARGWEDYEWRCQRAQGRKRHFGKSWQGEDIAGCTILLHAEQGLGDTLQFVRYAPTMAQRGCRVVLEVQPPLVRLLQGMPNIHQVVAQGDDLPAFDLHCPLMSLPRAFATTLETIPAALPYLHADPEAVAAWNVKLPDSGLRVGLVWSGSPHNDDAGAHLIDRRRSIALNEFAPLADLPGIHLVSLQKHGTEQAWTCPPGMTLIDPMADVNDFADTAALIANLDLVIAVDTSVAHLAAGMGRPVWLMSRYDGCWRWLHDREDSPWYPGMRIYRQQCPHDWPAVIARIRDDLAHATTASFTATTEPCFRSA